MKGGKGYVYQAFRCQFCARVIRIGYAALMMCNKPFCSEVCRSRYVRKYGL